MVQSPLEIALDYNTKLVGIVLLRNNCKHPDNLSDENLLRFNKWLEHSRNGNKIYLKDKQQEPENPQLKQIFSKLTFIESGSRAIIEFADIDFRNTQRISTKGNNGVVGKVKIHSDKLINRTSTFYNSNEEIAIKMMYNFNYFQGNEKDTEYQKNNFDKEYCFPISHPHWSHVRVFNSFRGRICAALLPDPTIDCLVDRTTYFIMELCKSNLQTYIDNHKGTITNYEGILIIFQILIGIKHLYSNNSVHLDLKPDNILLTNRKNIQCSVWLDL